MNATQMYFQAAHKEDSSTVYFMALDYQYNKLRRRMAAIEDEVDEDEEDVEEEEVEEFISYENSIKSRQSLDRKSFPPMMIIRGQVPLSNPPLLLSMTTPWEEEAEKKRNTEKESVKKAVDIHSIDKLYYFYRDFQAGNFILLARMRRDIYVFFCCRKLRYWHLCNCYRCQDRCRRGSSSERPSLFTFTTRDPRLFFDIFITKHIARNSHRFDRIYQSFIEDGMVKGMGIGMVTEDEEQEQEEEEEEEKVCDLYGLCCDVIYQRRVPTQSLPEKLVRFIETREALKRKRETLRHINWEKKKKKKKREKETGGGEEEEEEGRGKKSRRTE